MIICIYVYVIYKHTCMNIISVPFPCEHVSNLRICQASSTNIGHKDYAPPPKDSGSGLHPTSRSGSWDS